MKVLLTHRFFWPDTPPYALMLRKMGDALAAAGHEVHILSSLPSYRSDAQAETVLRRESLGALNVRRIRVFANERKNSFRRVANVLLYCWALLVTIIRLRPEVVTASTFPPVFAAWMASLAARFSGAQFIYHIQDIHPEVSSYTGGRLGRGLAARCLIALDNQSLRRAKVIVTLSEDMAETLKARGLGPLPVTVIQNPPLEVEANAEWNAMEVPADLAKDAGKVRVIFAGNTGRFQNLSMLAEGVAKCFADHPELELMFLGDGVALPELKSRWGDHPQVRFVPFLPYAQARGIIAGSDIGLVSLQPGLHRVASPSKVETYAALGLKIVALIDPESRLAARIERDGLGRVARTQTVDGVAEAIKASMADATVAAGPRSHPIGNPLGAWIELFRKLDARP